MSVARATEIRVARMRISSPIFDFALSPDEKTLLTLDAMMRLRCWQFPSLEPVDRAPHPAPDGIRTVAYSPYGRWLAFLTAAGGVKLYDGPSGRWRRDLEVRDRVIRSFAFYPDERRMVVCGSGGLLNFFDLVTGDELAPITAPRDAADISIVAVSPAGKAIAVVDERGLIHLLSESSGDK